jgi:predicted Zn-dependent protease
MIKKLLHIALFLSLSTILHAQHQDLFFTILGKCQTSEKPTSAIIRDNQRIIQSDEKLAEKLAYILDENHQKDDAFFIASLFPESTWGTFYLSRKAALENNAELSIELLHKHLSNTHRRLRLEIFSCQDFNPIRNSTEWKSLWENDGYSNSDLQYETALIYFRNQEYDWALEEINKLLSSYPQRDKYYALRSELYLAMNHSDAALSDIRNAITYNSRKASYHLIHAKILIESNKVDKAIHALETAENLNPYDADMEQLFIIAGSKTRNFNRWEKAEIYIQNTNNLEAIYYLATAKIQQNQFTDAIVLMNQVIEKDVSEAKYFIARGDAYKSTSLWSKAMYDYAMALDINPNLPEVYINYGICRLESGDQEGACYLWKRALHYKHPQANQYLYKWCE